MDASTEPGAGSAGADRALAADYAGKAGSYYVNSRPEMLAYVPANARRVLEVGCGSADFAALLKSRRSLHVTAIEAQPQAAEVARGRVDRLLAESIEQALETLRGERFDCIVANDVLEHLIDPWAVLRGLRALLAPGGAFVASIPNARYLPVFKAYVLRGLWQYADEGVLDRTHLRFFTRRSLDELFRATGWVLDRAEGINPIQVSWKFEWLNRLSRGALTDTRWLQFACVAHTSDSGPPSHR